MTGHRSGHDDGRAVPWVDLVFLWWAVLVPLGLSWGLLNMDGDLPRHLAIGDWILDHRRLPITYPFSFVKTDARFVPFEWLSGVILAGLHRAGGIPAVLVFAGLVIAATYTLLTRFLLRAGVPPAVAVPTALVAALLGMLFWRARPHLFTMLGVAVLLPVLERPTLRRGVLCLPLFGLWANLHGGFVYGWITIGAYVAGALLEAARGDRAGWLARARLHAVALGCAVAGALLTPHGLAHLAHVFGFLGQTRVVVDRTNEFLSPNFHLWPNQLFLLTLLAAIAALAASTRPLAGPRLVLLLLNVGFALYSIRNIHLFALTALPVLALHLAEGRRARPAGREGAGIVVGAALMAALALAGGRLAGREVIASAVDPAVFPVAAVEHARAAGWTGRLFNRLNWGGYVAHAWPGQRVFIDGSADFFGDSLFAEYVQIEQLEPGWRERLDERGFGLVLIPSRSSLAYSLQAVGGWDRIYCDGTAVIFRRSGTGDSSPAAGPGPRDPACPLA